MAAEALSLWVPRVPSPVGLSPVGVHRGAGTRDVLRVSSWVPTSRNVMVFAEWSWSGTHGTRSLSTLGVYTPNARSTWVAINALPASFMCTPSVVSRLCAFPADP